MPRPLKILVRTLLIVALLAVALVVGVRLFLPAEKLRDMAVARASEAMGRDVSVGDVGVSLRGGLGVRLADVRVGNPADFPAGDLLTARGVDLKLRLRPLLSKRVEADRLVIDGLHVSLRRLADERNNFTFAATDTAAAPAASPEEAAGGALELERCAVTDGRLVFQDDVSGFTTTLPGIRLDWTVGDGGRGALAVAGVSTADSLVLRGPRPFALGPWTLDADALFTLATKRLDVTAATLESGGLTVTGAGQITVPPTGPKLRFEVTGKDQDLPRLLALVPPEQAAAMEGVESAGAVDAALTVTWDGALPEPLGVDGTASLRDGRLSAPALPDPVTDVTGAVAFTMDTLDVTAAAARLGGAALSFQGAMAGLRTPTEATLRGALDADVDLAGFQDRLPAERKASLSGRASGRVRLDGRLNAPQALLAGGELTLTDVRYADATLTDPITDLDAALAFDRRDLTLKNCRVVFASSDMTITGKAVGAVPAFTDSTAPPPRLEFALASTRLNADRLFPPASPGAAPRQPAREVHVVREFPDIVGNGTLSVDRLIYAGTTFRQVRGTVRIADQTLTVSGAEAQVFAGTVSGETSVDLRDMAAPKYKGTFAAKAVQADSLLTHFTPLKGLVFGDLDFQGDLSAAGLDPADFRKSLALSASSRLSQGRLVTTGTVRQGLTALSDKLGRGFSGEESLRNLAGHVRVAGEKVLFDDLACALPGLGDLTLTGGYALTGGLDLDGTLLLTPEHSRKLLGGGVGGALGGLLGGGGSDQRLALPVSLGGTFSSPEVGLDLSAVAETAGQNAVDELKGKLGGLLRR